MIGVGVGVGFGGVGLSPSWLVTKLQGHFGASLAELVIGDDLVIVAGAVDSAPARVGSALTNANANKFPAGSLGGRLAIGGSAATAGALVYNGAYTAKSVWVLTEGCEGVSVAGDVLDIDYSTSDVRFVRDAQTSHWLAVAAGTFYCDGAATAEIPTSGTHLFEVARASGISNGTHMQGYSGAARGWPGATALYMVLTAVPAAGVRAAAVADILRYWRAA